MPLLTNAMPETRYKSNQANTLYGSGNSDYSADQIKNFINTPGRTDQQVLGEALAKGISAAQVSQAMGGQGNYGAANVDKYLANQGITKELADPMVPNVADPYAVKATPIIVGSKETANGQMQGLMEDPNSPLNVMAQTYGKQYANQRGLLNSSIAASATQDAMYKNAQPIASQDASTNYDAAKTNSAQTLTADMFNSDLTSRVGMFNAGTQKDMSMNTQNQNMNYAIANMDSQNKLAIANVQAMANDSGIMGDLGKSMMSLYQQTAADPNITPQVKDQIFNNLKTQFENLSGLLPSFAQAGQNLAFGSASSTGGASNTTSTSGANWVSGSTTGSGSGAVSGSDSGGSSAATPAVKSNIDALNTLGYKPEPYVLGNVNAYERATGNKVDRSLVVPEQLIEDLNAFGSAGFTNAYLSKDGTNKIRNIGAYDLPALMKRFGFNDVNQLQSLFIPIHPPGTMRADGPMFYVFDTNKLGG